MGQLNNLIFDKKIGWCARVILVPSLHPPGHDHQHHLNGSANGRQFNHFPYFFFLFLSLWCPAHLFFGQYSVVAPFLSVSQQSLIHSFVITICIICSTAWWTHSTIEYYYLWTQLLESDSFDQLTWHIKSTKNSQKRLVSRDHCSSRLTIWLKSTDRFPNRFHSQPLAMILHLLLLLLNNGNRGITHWLSHSRKGFTWLHHDVWEFYSFGSTGPEWTQSGVLDTSLSSATKIPPNSVSAQWWNSLIEYRLCSAIHVMPLQFQGAHP